MMGRAGLSPGAALAVALSGCEITPPRWPLSVLIYQTLADWNETQERSGQPAIAAPALLAELLELRLEEGGYCLSAQHDGCARVFVASGLEKVLADFTADFEQ